MTNLYLVGDKIKKRRFRKYDSFVSLDGAILARKNKVMPKAFIVADNLHTAIYRFLLQVNYFELLGNKSAKEIKTTYNNALFGISEKTIEKALKDVEIIAYSWSIEK